VFQRQYAARTHGPHLHAKEFYIEILNDSFLQVHEELIVVNLVPNDRSLQPFFGALKVLSRKDNFWTISSQDRNM